MKQKPTQTAAILLATIVGRQLDQARAREGVGHAVGQMAHQVLRDDQRIDAGGQKIGIGLQHLGRVIAQVRLAVGGVPLLLQGIEGVKQPGVEARGRAGDQIGTGRGCFT